MAKVKIPNIKPGTPVIIRWFDAHQDPSEMGEAKDILDFDCECEDIGWWCGAKGLFITIAVEKYRGSWAGQYRHTNRIPKVNILEIKVLDDPANGSGTNDSIQQNSEGGNDARSGRKPRARRGGEGVANTHPLTAQPTGDSVNANDGEAK
jgi:hypothetical protein